MKKEDGIALGHLVNSLQDAVNKLERSYKNGDKQAFEGVRKEVLDIQRRIDSLLR